MARDVQVWRSKVFSGIELLEGRIGVNEDHIQHFHETYQLGITDQGAKSLMVSGARHILPAGVFSIVAPSEAHTGAALEEQGVWFRFMHINPTVIEQILAEVTEQPPIARQFPVMLNSPDLRPSFLNVFNSIARDATPLEQESHVFGLLARLWQVSQQCTVKRSYPEHRATRIVREFIREHSPERVSLTALQHATGFNKHYLLQVFKRDLGLSPHEYQTSLRVNKARRLLARGRTIASVALETGFGDQSHLHRAFRQQLLLTPGRYQRGLGSLRRI